MRPFGLVLHQIHWKPDRCAFLGLNFDGLVARGEGMRKGDQTRERIIAQAAPIFNQKGFVGCSIQDLMKATGLGKGGIYRHFNDKEELAAEAFRYATSTAVKFRTEKLDANENAMEQLRGFVHRFVTVPSPIPGGCPLMNTAIDSDDGNPVLRELAAEGIRNWRSRLAEVVSAGVRRGEIRAEIVPRAVANAIIAMLEGALMISRVEGTRTALLDGKAALEGYIDSIGAD